MKLVKLQCPNCGATFTVSHDSDTVVCEYCGTAVTVPRKKARIKVERRNVNYKALGIFGVVAALIIVVAVIIVFTVGKKDVDPRAFKSDGVYLVGEDIPAGEYVLYPNVGKNAGDVTPVLEVRKTREAAVDTSELLYRKEFFMRQYVNLNEGEYIAFEHALMYLPEKADLGEIDEKGFSSAQLKVGKDIAAGEYVVVGDNKQTQYFITSKPEAALYGTAALNAPEMLSFGYCENRVYLKVHDGEYLSFIGGRLYKSGDAPEPRKSENGELLAGQYKVGTDIRAGRYTVSPAVNKRSLAYVCLNKNAVNTSSVPKWDEELIAQGGETLWLVRLEDYDGSVEIEIPDPDGYELYLTLWYCTASS